MREEKKAAPAAVAGPSGWKLVPVEPTPEMQNACLTVVDLTQGDVEDHRYDDGRSTVNALYRAMLAAAPQPPVAVQEPAASVYTMEALVPGAHAKCHVTLHKPLPAGTKLYTHPAPQPAPAAQGDALDTERLDWLTFNISGKALRDIGVLWSEYGDARRAIDAARAQAKEGGA